MYFFFEGWENARFYLGMILDLPGLPHTRRNLRHGEALWTFTKTTRQNARFTVKVKRKLKNLRQQRFMWDQKAASLAVNDWKQMRRLAAEM